jgi:hypothetical protein
MTSESEDSGRRRWVRSLAILVVGLVVLLVVADRIACTVVQGVAAGTIQQSEHLAHKPSVSVAGFPFLTQFATSSYDDIKVVAKDVDVGLSTLRLRVERVEVKLHSVKITHDFKNVHAEDAEAHVTISYEDLSKALGATISYAGSGRIRASSAATIGGISLRGSITSLPKITADKLTFSDPKISIAGASPPAQLVALLNRVFNRPIQLSNLPFGLDFTALAAGEDGIAVELAGKDLEYEGAEVESPEEGEHDGSEATEPGEHAESSEDSESGEHQGE